MRCEPVPRSDAVYVAVPPTRVCSVPTGVPSTENCTVPVGVPVPALGATVAVKLTVSPTIEGFLDEVTVVVVAGSALAAGKTASFEMSYGVYVSWSGLFGTSGPVGTLMLFHTPPTHMSPSKKLIVQTP